MSCPICGDRCTCSQSGAELHTSILIDPELPETSEEEFEASLATEFDVAARAQAHEEAFTSAPQANDSEPWRQEIASRVDAFCARRGRRRGPRLPSLSFDFEPPARGASESSVVASRGAVAHAIEAPPAAEPEPTNLIEFPRPVAPLSPPPIPVQLPIVDELAEPIIQTPRILEAEPENAGLLFGGEPMPSITLETAPALPAETYPEPAVLGHRAAAGVIDAILVLAATGMFAGVVTKLVGTLPVNRTALVMAMTVPASLWALYEYMFWVYAGATVGMRIAKLDLRTFEAAPVPRRKRRWRAIAMMVSAMSLGMGFLWAVIDEDGLCWHDRISRTLLRPRQS